jgi:hypothetical protein
MFLTVQWILAPSDCSSLRFSVTKQRLGYAIFGLYIAQIVIGLFIHFVRVPFLFLFHRPPQNYVHVILGLVILAMAGYQVRLF